MKNEFKLNFDFKSLIFIGALIGFCAGIVSIPLQLFGLLSDEIPLLHLLIILVASPILGLINGGFLSLVAYPFYWWFSQKIGFTYKGKIYVVK